MRGTDLLDSFVVSFGGNASGVKGWLLKRRYQHN